mgnify:CR=1 FL=1
MWKALDRIVSAIIRRLFKPKYHVERVERYQLPGRLRIVKWCAAPADAAGAHLLHRRRAPVR